MIETLKKYYKKIKYTNDWIIAYGNIPIALVAHMDTVFAAPPTEIFYDENAEVMWSPDGLGADDRAGIYAILELISRGYRPHIIFTTDEEKGGIGASKLVGHYKKCPFKHLKYIIELDRQGYNDCVFYNCDNEEFERYVENFGFSGDWGTFSDISIIAPAWGAAAVNLSVGYKDEHNFIERLYCRVLDLTINKVESMLVQHKEAPKFKYIPAKESFNFSFAGINWEDYFKEEEEEDETIPDGFYKCAWCEQLEFNTHKKEYLGLCKTCYGYTLDNGEDEEALLTI